MLKELYQFSTPWAKANWCQLQKNRILGLLANIYYPIYCMIENSNISELKNEVKSLSNERIVVSLTSYPARIEKIYLTINSILRQHKKADRVVLWLADVQFPNGRKSLPSKLLELQKYGLEIRFVNNDIKSYKKIFYVAQEEKNSIIITADDDILYPENWIEELIENYYRFPKCVSCYRAHLITFSENGDINSYQKWSALSPDMTGPSDFLVPIGVGGVLYPPYYFENVDFDIKKIEALCPTADDLWLKAIGIKNGYQAVKVHKNSIEWFTIRGSQKTSLMSMNTVENYQGTALNDIALDNLLNYFGISYNNCKWRIENENKD